MVFSLYEISFVLYKCCIMLVCLVFISLFIIHEHQRWSNRTRVLVLVLEYEYVLSTRTRTRVRKKVIVLVLEYITKVIVLTITFHDYIFFI